jgi:CRISPR-associated protein Csb2
MLAIEVTLLTGRYVATSFDNRGCAEWPPHPARLFAALCATHFESLEARTEEREALVWLECQGDPQILAPEVSERDVVTVFVPVNDTSVVRSFDDELFAIHALREDAIRLRREGSKSLAGAEKRLVKAEGKLVNEMSKAVAPLPPGKENKEALEKAERLLPERRTRQPRTFPSVAPLEMDGSSPAIVFSWSLAAPTSAQRECLDALAARVVRLGHSSSLVSVRVRERMPNPNWVPDKPGIRSTDELVLRSVEIGQVEALETAFVLRGEEPGRVLPSSFRRYVRPLDSEDLALPASIFGEDWVILRRAEQRNPQDRVPRLPSTRGHDVAATVRKALMSAYGPDAPEILTGHRPSGDPSERPHLAYVPLPIVGHEHADGSLTGVALVLPREATSEDRRSVYRAIDAWERGARSHEEEDVRLPVHLGRIGVLQLVREEGGSSLVTLRPATWCIASRKWASAMPVALDRNPGDLRSKDPNKETKAYGEAEASVALACERIGLPRPARVTVTVAAPLAGGEKTRHFPAFRLGNIQRVLVHAILEFDTPVRGPILLGAGRYLGLGLFRPLRDHG